MTLNEQIGLLIGENIVRDKLITLSTDMLKSDNVIEVDNNLSDIWKKMHDTCFKLSRAKKEDEYTKMFYENLAWYKKNIEQVYLPKEITYHSHAYYTNEKEFIRGIELALWDCDMSHYRFHNIKKGKYTNTIILKYEL